MSNQPRLLLIADRFTMPGLMDRVQQAIQGGVRWVHLRDHDAPPNRFAAAARTMVRFCKASGVQVSINTRVDLAAAWQVGAHVGVRGPEVATARARLGPDAVLGLSVHAGRVLPEAVIAKINYVTFSPVYPTCSKPGHPGTGPDALAHFCRQHPGLPVYALGGITVDRVAEVLEAGAYGVAVLSGILHAPNPQAAARLYLQAVRTHLQTP